MTPSAAIAIEPVVLCVDGEANILQSLQRVLRREPYQVVTATSATAACRIMRDQPVHVVVADAVLPDSSAVAFWETVGELAPEAVGMVLTGHAELADIVDAINVGHVYFFLPKPWDNAHLRRAVGACLLEGVRRGAGLPARLLEELPVPVLLFAADASIRYVNRAGRRRLRAARGGQPRRLPPQLQRAIAAALAGGGACEDHAGRVIPVTDEYRRPGCLVVVNDNHQPAEEVPRT